MGRRGPPRAAKKILSMRGSWRAGRRAAEVKAESGIPQCPELLQGTAREVWDKLVAQLDQMGVLAKIDQNNLALYCQLYSRWVDCEKLLDKNGHTFPLKKVIDVGDKQKAVIVGYRPYPEVAIANSLATQLTKLGSQFGLTPMSRAQLSPESQSNDEDSQKTEENFFKLG